MWSIAFWLTLFVASQAICQVVFKYGSLTQGAAVPHWVMANVIGVAGSYILIVLYRKMNVNVAMGVAFGLSFLVTQIVLAVVFRSRLSGIQGAGVLLITLGVFAVAAFPSGPPK